MKKNLKKLMLNLGMLMPTVAIPLVVASCWWGPKRPDLNLMILQKNQKRNLRKKKDILLENQLMKNMLKIIMFIILKT